MVKISKFKSGIFFFCMSNLFVNQRKIYIKILTTHIYFKAQENLDQFSNMWPTLI